MTVYDPILPPPSLFGLPDVFSAWRPDQDRAAMAIYESEKSAIAAVAPTGFGKSPLAVAVASMIKAVKPDARTVYLTETKALQKQLLDDFDSIGMVDVRGQSNYECIRIREDESRSEKCDSGPCHAGVECELKATGCTYYDAFRRAKWSDLVLTNYDYWLNINRNVQKEDDALGQFDLLVLDEAHGAPDKVCDFLSTEIRAEAVEGILGSRMLPRDAKIEDWGTWAYDHRRQAQSRHDHLAQIAKSNGTRLNYDQRYELKMLRGLLTQLATVQMAADDAANWIVDRSKGNDAHFDPIWPAKYVNQLTQGTPKTLLLSATIRPKTLDLLGFPRDTTEFLEYPSSFPVERRLVTWVPTVPLKHTNTPEQRKEWVRRIDQIIARRLDRKGLVHTVSFEKARFLYEHSAYSQHMILNESKTTQVTVDRFRKAPAPAILVSPSVGTGFDFPYTQAEYCVIGKVPFLDTRSPVMKARVDQDPTYSNYMAAQEMVQMAGRCMRAADDRGEVLVVDDQIGWFFYKNLAMFPQWFIEAFRKSSYVPAPPPKLEMHDAD